MQTSARVDIPTIKIKTPTDISFWRKVGIEVTKDIRKKTLSGRDADNKTFKPYKKATIKERTSRGRSSRVNLTDSGKMLGAMTHGIRPTKHGVRLLLTGEQGFKAWNIQNNQKRVFFALNDKQVKRIIQVISKWITKKNK